MEHNEHILTYNAHKDNDYLNGLLFYMNERIEDDDSEFTARQNYFVELHYAKGRETYPNKNSSNVGGILSSNIEPVASASQSALNFPLHNSTFTINSSGVNTLSVKVVVPASFQSQAPF